ncbi:MotA/TolQ/ExbB proton channel family protein [Haloferula sp. BvORR071]|uniref:MotA/TolQ/ExbB proton channel family protein n=1 Tax=Haloferula sp. BvORR071 TaxID=1396141 RepID=UPI0009467DF3|nr:MotA/TolQ/ExbB proton channel family protein [Haloferula sp. BvORR071]
MAAVFLPTLAAAAEAAPEPKQEVDLLHIYHQGGFSMPILAVMSVLTVVLILLYLLLLRRNAVVSDRFMNNAEALIRRNDFLGLIAYCSRRNECMARITQRALEFMTKNSGATFSEVRDVAEAEGSRQSSLLTTRVSYLADIGAIAPMVGLLGTVVGMIKSFYHVSDGGFQGARQMAFAGGVSEALIATAAGLSIALPALIFYAYFRGKVQKLISDLEGAATHLMAILRTQVDRHAAAQAAAAAPRPAARREEYAAVPIPTHLTDDRPDLHGI